MSEATSHCITQLRSISKRGAAEPSVLDIGRQIVRLSMHMEHLRTELHSMPKAFGRAVARERIACPQLSLTYGF